MATIEREFYRSARGPAPTDEDTWRLVFDARAMRLLVQHNRKPPDIAASMSSRSPNFSRRTEPLRQS